MRITAIVIAIVLGLPAFTLAQAATAAKGRVEVAAFQQLAATANVKSALTPSGKQIGGALRLRLPQASAQSATSEEHSWPVRHPILFGTLLGGGLGGLSAGLWCGGVPCDENEYGRGFYVLSGGAIGAGLGAGVGFVVALLRR